MVLRLLLLFFVLTACTPRADVLALHDDWTGFDTLTTPEHEIFRDGSGIMTVRPVMITRDGRRIFGILTNLRRLVPNGPIIEKMETNGVPLRYQRHDRLLTHCSSGCRRAETGVIRLSEAEFRAAAINGLPLRVYGRRGRYHGTVPPELLRALLARIDGAPP